MKLASTNEVQRCELCPRSACIMPRRAEFAITLHGRPGTEDHQMHLCRDCYAAYQARMGRKDMVAA